MLNTGNVGVGYGAGGGFFSGFSINDGLWHNVLATFDGTTTTLYVDNNIVGTNNATLNTIPTTLKFMRFQVNNTDIDEVGFWNRVLTPTEITTLYNAGAGLTYPFSPPITGNPSFLLNII
jgi:hypothetical protein